MSGTGFTLSLELGERALVQETVGCAEAGVGAPASSSTSMVPLRVLAALPGVLMSCLRQDDVQALSCLFSLSDVFLAPQHCAWLAPASHSFRMQCGPVLGAEVPGDKGQRLV